MSEFLQSIDQTRCWREGAGTSGPALFTARCDSATPFHTAGLGLPEDRQLPYEPGGASIPVVLSGGGAPAAIAADPAGNAAPPGPKAGAERDITAALTAAIGSAWLGVDSAAASALLTLDFVSLGVLLLPAHGAMALKNREARRIIELRDGLSCDAHGRLHCSDPAAGQALRRFATALASAPRDRQTPRLRLSCAVRRPSGERPFIVDAAQLGGTSGAVVTIVDPARRNPDMTMRLRHLFHLTACEAEVCTLIADGLSNGEIAQHRGVSTETVKSQSSSIMRKMAVTNRVDLVRMVMSATTQVGSIDDKNF
jgi:DNA-binding CsgD family transcriptional regulator